MNEKYFVNLTKCGRSLITKKRELLFGSQRSASRTIGMNQSIISDWERGRYRPTLSNFIEYLNYLKINPKFLDSSKLSNIVYFSPYEKDAPEIKKLLELIGIKSSVTNHNQILRISGRENLKAFDGKINFIINRKRKSLEDLLGSYKRRQDCF